MNNPVRRSVIPDASVLVESWERAAAGLDEDDALRPACGVLTALSIGIPIDISLLVWVVL